jgi:hypothetical protein
MADYFFLAPSLPELVLGQKPELSFEELKARLAINLNKEDLAQAVVLSLYVDINNIRSLLMEETIDPRGNLTEKELDEALLIHNILPGYVFDFLDQYDNVADKIRHFSAVLAKFFEEEIPQQNGFLRKYLIFEREWRLVMIALRAKELGRDVSHELQFEDFSDPLVAQILAQKDADRYEPPAEYQDLKELLASCGEDPWEKYKAFARWRFQKIEEMVDRPLFSMDWILAYMAQLIIVEQWNELDESRGRMILETFRNE